MIDKHNSAAICFCPGICKTSRRIIRHPAAKSILIAYMALASTSFAVTRQMERAIGVDGREIIIINVPGSPPPAIRPAPVKVPRSSVAKGIKTISQVPAFSWCYGCAPTAAAMMMGYYDNIRYNNMYAGPANGGVCPMENDSFWGYEESPLSATHKGIDGRTARGHVEDYWIAADNPGPDPYINNGWTEHAHADCTADFMGTSQSKFEKKDGETSFFSYPDGSPLEDFTLFEPSLRDGCHGMKLFANSRGYTVISNYSQLIYGYDGNTLGFTYDDFKAEIDANRPVLIHLVGHTMLGYGYNDSGSLIYVHDTWDNDDHSMTWGGTYAGMTQKLVTVFQCHPIALISRLWALSFPRI